MPAREPRKARRCPMCGTVNRPTVQHCECGHDFDAAGKGDDGQRLDAFLRGRVATGWVMVVGGFLLVALSVFLIVLGIPGVWDPKIMLFSRIAGIGAVSASVALFVKGTRVVDAAGRSLRELDNLPQATIVKRES